MKVVFAVDSMNSGGTERVVSILANYFASELGIETYILMVSSMRCNSFYKLDKRIKLVAALENVKKRNRLNKRIQILKKIITTIQPDIVVAMLPHVIAYSYFALKGLKISFVVSERNNPYKHNIIYKALNRLIFKKANYCVFQTEGAANFYNLKKDKYKIIINPVFLNFDYDSNFETINGFAAAGRLVKQKNYFFMIDCFRKFESKHPGYHLNIYGDGPLKNKINRYILKHNLQDRVFLKGRDPLWLKNEYKSSCFLMTSLFEGMPNSLMESLYVGMPAVVTDCPPGGPREVIELFGRGFLSSFKEDDYIKKMEACLNERRNVDGRAISSVSTKTVCEEWYKVILNILEE